MQILTDELLGLLESFVHVPVIANGDDDFAALAKVGERLVRYTLDAARASTNAFDFRDVLEVAKTRLSGLMLLFTAMQRLADYSAAQWARSCVVRVTRLLHAIPLAVSGQSIDAAVPEHLKPPVAADNSTSGASFRFESQLRDFLVNNLPTLPGHSRPLSLYRCNGRNAVEFRTDVGLIDILAVGKGDFYVLEVKLGRATDAALGQLLRYMGWVKAHLADGKRVFGVVIASVISPKLMYAASNMADVHLLQYGVAFSLGHVSHVGA